MLWQDMVPCTEHRAVADKLEALLVEQDESTKQISALQSQFSVAEVELVTAKEECEALRAQACESTRVAEELERRLSSELEAARYFCLACLDWIGPLV